MLTRRDFLLKALPLATAGMALAPTVAQASTFTFPKGTYLAKGFKAALVNQLSVDYIVGDDGVIQDVWKEDYTALRQLTCEYIHRFPFRFNSAYEIASVRANLPTFRNRWMVMNEPLIENRAPVETIAAYASEIISGVVATNPGISNYFILDVFSGLSQYDPTLNLDYVSTLWGYMTPAAKSKVSAFGAHIYPTTHDYHEPRLKMKDCRRRMNFLGLTALPLILTETGFGATDMLQTEAQTYIPAMAGDLAGITGGWFGGVSWFAFNWGNYCSLAKTNGLGLTRAGNAWANL